MAKTASWWDKGTSTGGVIAHTPDATKYHVPDAKQNGTMRAGITNAVMIPRGRADGSSTGFNHHEPEIIHVDPDAPGGGVTIDPKKLSNVNTRKVLSQLGGPVGTPEDADRMYAAWEMLSATAGTTANRRGDANTVVAEPVADPHVMAGGYVTPRSDTNGVQLSPPHQTQESVAMVQPSARPVLESQPQPEAALRGEACSPASLVKPGQTAAPDMLSLMHQMAAALSMLAADRLKQAEVSPEPLATLATLAPPAPPAPPATLPPHSRPLSSAPVPAPPLAADSARSAPQIPAISDPLASLGMEFLGLHPVKPKVSVIFELGQAGNTEVKYHAVLVSAKCIILVYDTRYEDGIVYLPPARPAGQPFPLHIRSDVKGKGSYTVESLGISFDLGCLDCVLLIVSGASKEVLPTGLQAEDAWTPPQI